VSDSYREPNGFAEGEPGISASVSSGPAERRVRTQVGEVRVLCQGSGEPALLLHGIGSSADSFRSQLGELSDAFAMIAWDAPGYGASGDLERPLTLDEYAQAAVDVLDAKDVERAHIAGVSWGGVIATRLALHDPQRVASLALIGSTPGRAGNPAAVENLRARAEWIERGELAHFASDRVRELVADGTSPAVAREVEEIMVGSVHPIGFRSAAESLARTDHAPDLNRIEAPTLVVTGDADAITGLPESRALAAGIALARLVVIESCGHLPNQEQPEVVNTELREHWEGNRARSRARH